MNAQSLISSNIQLHETIQVFITNDTILTICVNEKDGSTMCVKGWFIQHTEEHTRMYRRGIVNLKSLCGLCDNPQCYKNST